MPFLNKLILWHQKEAFMKIFRYKLIIMDKPPFWLNCPVMNLFHIQPKSIFLFSLCFEIGIWIGVNYFYSWWIFFPWHCCQSPRWRNAQGISLCCWYLPKLCDTKYVCTSIWIIQHLLCKMLLHFSKAIKY